MGEVACPRVTRSTSGGSLRQSNALQGGARCIAGAYRSCARSAPVHRVPACAEHPCACVQRQEWAPPAQGASPRVDTPAWRPAAAACARCGMCAPAAQRVGCCPCPAPPTHMDPLTASNWGAAACLAAPHVLYAFIWQHPRAWLRAFPKQAVQAFENAAWALKGEGGRVARDKRVMARSSHTLTRPPFAACSAAVLGGGLLVLAAAPRGCRAGGAAAAAGRGGPGAAGGGAGVRAVRGGGGSIACCLLGARASPAPVGAAIREAGWVARGQAAQGATLPAARPPTHAPPTPPPRCARRA